MGRVKYKGLRAVQLIAGKRIHSGKFGAKPADWLLRFACLSMAVVNEKYWSLQATKCRIPASTSTCRHIQIISTQLLQGQKENDSP